MNFKPVRIFCAVALVAGHTLNAQASGLGGLWNSIREVLPADVLVPPNSSPAARASAQTRPEKVRPLPVSANFKPIRSDSDSRRLFESGKITGEQALTELRAMRKAMGAGDMQLAMTQLFGHAPQAMQSSSSTGLPFDMRALNVRGLGKSMQDRLIAGMSIHALEQFFNTLTENPEYFAKESVDLPRDVARFTPVQRQRVLILATTLIAIKGSNMIVEASEIDYKRAADGYKGLLDKREQAAALLATAIENWRLASGEQRELVARNELQALSPEDLEFLSRFPADMKLKDFARDFTVQNIALQYLRMNGDAGFKDYRAQADEYVSNISGHMRKTVGLGSLLGFSSLFLREGEKAFEQEGIQSIKVVLPFLDQYLVEMGTAVSVGLPGWFTGIGKSLWGGEREFRIEKLDGSVVKKNASASDVVGFIRDNDATGQQFKSQLYRNDNQGYMYRVNLCANNAAGLLDKAVADDTKQSFVKGFYKLEDASGFNFRDAFEGAYQPKRRNEVVSSLLSADYRDKSRNDSERAIGQVQSATADGFVKWEARDLAQIIFASSLDRPSAHARLQLGDHVVRMQPSHWMVYEYENYQQHCLEDVTARLKQDQTRVSEVSSGGKTTRR